MPRKMPHRTKIKPPVKPGFHWTLLLTAKGVWGLWLALLCVVPIGNGILWLTGVNDLTELRPSMFVHHYYPPGEYLETHHYHGTITYSAAASYTDRRRVWKTTLSNRYLHLYREGEITVVVQSDKPKPEPYYMGAVRSTPRLLRELPPAQYEMIVAKQLAPLGFAARENWLGSYLFFVHWLPIYGEATLDE